MGGCTCCTCVPLDFRTLPTQNRVQARKSYCYARFWIAGTQGRGTIVPTIRGLTQSVLTIAFLCAGLFLQVADLSTAESLMGAGHWKRARIILQERVRNNPRDAKAAYLFAQLKLAFGLRDEALKLAERAAEIDNRNADYHVLLSRIYGESAENSGAIMRLVNGSRFRKEAETALSLDPKHLDARYALMLFYFNAPEAFGGDRKKAHALADEIVRIDPWEG